LRVTSSLHLTSTLLTVDDFERAVGLRADFRWGKGDHKFSREGLHMGGFQPDAHSEFELFEGRELPFEEALEECASGLSHLRDLFAKVTESGGSAQLCVCRPIRWDSGDIAPAGPLRNIQAIGLDLTFEVSRPSECEGEDVNVPTADVDAIQSFVQALMDADDDPGSPLTVCIKYRNDRSVYEHWVPNKLDTFTAYGLRDPGFGSGPVNYSDIEWICVPAVPCWPRKLPEYAKKFEALVALCAGMSAVTITRDELTFNPTVAGTGPR